MGRNTFEYKETAQEQDDEIIILGASGATGKLLVQLLIERGETVRVIVRSARKFEATFVSSPKLSVIEANVLDLSKAEWSEHLKNCKAIVSCLGHNGAFGSPSRLVTKTTKRVCQTLLTCSTKPAVKFILMSATGVRNSDINERVSLAERLVVFLMMALLPPFSDNVAAAKYLRSKIGKNDSRLDWAVIRPDDLIDESVVSGFKVHASPTRSGIFNAGTTSRINVASFMADLIVHEETWNKWRGSMPVIYND